MAEFHRYCYIKARHKSIHTVRIKRVVACGWGGAEVEGDLTAPNGVMEILYILTGVLVIRMGIYISQNSTS